MKNEINPIIWKLLWPIRAYIRYFPSPRGKGFLARHFIYPVLPSEETFLAVLYHDLKIRLRYSEALGRAVLLQGGFETAEIEFLCKKISAGDTVLDVGANIGIFSMAFADAVDTQGKVLALEPLPQNIERLKNNLKLNHLQNVQIFPVAAGQVNGKVKIHLANDLAFASVIAVKGQHGNNLVMTISMRKLDEIWQQVGSPPVTVLKIDVEGGELEVLKGAEELIKVCQPLIMAEANTKKYLDNLKSWLLPRGYIHKHPTQFKPWNHLFESRQPTIATSLK
jgi:FkbM family methyltransferase